MSNNSHPIAGLIQSNVEALEEGCQLLSILDPGQYTQALKPTFQSTIGAHFRHAMEHYLCFIEQLPDGVISYDQRCRDQQLEEDISYARQVLQDICSKLGGFYGKQADIGQLEINDQPLTGSIVTTVERELLFLLSHTVHHYAIIGAMARGLGKAPQSDFGVAIATQTYQASCFGTNINSRPASGSS